jgi:GntR family transcriptional regulator / MocR family aminotransferase
VKRRSGIFLLSLVQLDEGKSEPLYKQLYESLRQAILSGQLHTRVRLPSIRDLSTLLNISRNTVTHALDQLTAEGYLETKPGAGTFVTHQLPDDLLRVRFDSTQLLKPAAAARRYSQRSNLITDLPQTWVISSQKGPAFRYGLPALDHFPRHIWARLAARRYRYGPTKYFDFTLMSAGHQPLREATAEYLRSSRGVKCHADQASLEPSLVPFPSTTRALT